jgi:Flp pilus assembly pilin Flp
MLVGKADMSNFISSFWSDEEGAVTVEWVVMAAGLCAVGIGLLVAVRSGAGTMARGAQGQISSSTPTIR